jgi:hypothetical protein
MSDRNKIIKKPIESNRPEKSKKYKVKMKIPFSSETNNEQQLTRNIALI